VDYAVTVYVVAAKTGAVRGYAKPAYRVPAASTKRGAQRDFQRGQST
jgi:hypothetical protein